MIDSKPSRTNRVDIFPIVQPYTGHTLIEVNIEQPTSRLIRATNDLISDNPFTNSNSEVMISSVFMKSKAADMFSEINDNLKSLSKVTPILFKSVWLESSLQEPYKIREELNGEDLTRVQFLKQDVQEYSPVLDSLSNISKSWNETKDRVLYSFGELMDKHLKNEKSDYLIRSFSSIQRHNYDNIIDILESDFKNGFLPNDAGIVSALEYAFNISKLVTTNQLRRLELEDIQSDLISLNVLVSKKDRNEEDKFRINEIKCTILEKLKSRKELNKFLESIGTNEKELENKLEYIDNPDGGFEIRWKNH